MYKMKKRPHLIVVTCIYNHLERLNSLFDSMLNQTYRDFTHYIYDDFSNENPDLTVNRYINKVRCSSVPYEVIYEKGQSNLGVDLAHQHCFKNIKGDYFIWLDVGDYVKKDFLKKASKIIMNHKDIHIVHFNGVHIDEKGNVDKKPVSKQVNGKYLRMKKQLPCYCYGNFIYNLFAVDTSFFKLVNPECFFVDGKTFGGFFYDNQIMFELLLAGAKTYFIRKPLFYKLYERKSVSVSFVQDKSRIDDGKKLLFKTLPSIQLQEKSYFQYVCLIESYRKMKSMFFQNRFNDNIIIYKSLKSFFKECDKRYKWLEHFRCTFLYMVSRHKTLRFLGFLLLKNE